MAGLLRGFANAATVTGATLQGYGADEQRRVVNALAAKKQASDEENDRILNAFRKKETELMGATKPFTKPPTANPGEGVLQPDGTYKVEVAPAAPKSKTSTQILSSTDPSEPPKAVIITEHDDAPPTISSAPIPGVTKGSTNAGSAAIQQKVAANRTQLSVIDDALKELDAHPEAVGLSRGVGEMIPLLGGVQDAANQRTDPEGVAARAQIANIGSLKMHDRSGAAVTLSEFPRLKPFIPSVGDTPDAIRQKLGKLRASIVTETDELAKGGTPPAGAAAPTRASAAPVHSAMSDEEFAKAWKAGLFKNP